jgi:hypothetical protein
MRNSASESGASTPKLRALMAVNSTLFPFKALVRYRPKETPFSDGPKSTTAR